MHTINRKQHNPSLADWTVGEVVADDYRTAEVFQRHGIDFCCGGEKALSVAYSE